ncbi:MAG TPA: hypothetical protein VNU49_07345 [Opitutaceae bacterium]|nr:hypothetical protein [Opitutaceae bacterium]
MHPSFRFFPSVAFAFALALLLAGCGGEPKLEPAPVVALGPNGKPLPLMMAKGAFFDGKLLAQIMLSQSKGRGGFHPTPIHGLPSPDDDSANNDDVTLTPEIIDEIRSRRGESPIQPIVMWLQLTSTTSNPLNVGIIDFDSDLGNFAVQPEQIALPPGRSVEAEPMISRLGVTSLEIPVTVTLRLNGKTETHVLTLQPVDSANQSPITP